MRFIMFINEVTMQPILSPAWSQTSPKTVIQQLALYSTIGLFKKLQVTHGRGFASHSYKIQITQKSKPTVYLQQLPFIHQFLGFFEVDDHFSTKKFISCEICRSLTRFMQFSGIREFVIEAINMLQSMVTSIRTYHRNSFSMLWKIWASMNCGTYEKGLHFRFQSVYSHNGRRLPGRSDFTT